MTVQRKIEVYEEARDYVLNHYDSLVYLCIYLAPYVGQKPNVFNPKDMENYFPELYLKRTNIHPRAQVLWKDNRERLVALNEVINELQGIL